MDKVRYLVEAHLVEGRPVAALAREHGLHRATLYKALARYRVGGPEALAPKSRRPHRSPTQTPIEIEEAIVLLRKQLGDEGLDAGADTIHYHLARQFDAVPSVTTIWRILHRRGFVTPQPAKRPRSSFIRFEADLPNEMWQSDMTHWNLGDGSGVEIITFIDDCSRMIVGCDVVEVARATDVAKGFAQAGGRFGYPASVLTDNGCIYTAKHRGGKVALESQLERLGIVFKHGKPYHPQTQGKIERFQQTLKKWLAHQAPADDMAMLQRQLDWFCRYYNEVRPHRSLGRRTPKSVYDSQVKAQPGELESTQFRVRYDRVDKAGSLTIRYHSKLHHIAVGRAYRQRAVVLLVADRDIRVVDRETGELLRQLTLDPSRDYQRQEPG